MTKKFSVLEVVETTAWLINDDALSNIKAIAARENENSGSDFEEKEPNPVYSVEGNVGVVKIDGPVFPKANLFTQISGATSNDVIISALREAENDDSIERVIVEYATPGGVAEGAAEISDMIANYAKPIVSFVPRKACSLGYFWASQAPIYITDDALLGNIGTRGRAPDQPESNEMFSKNAGKKALDVEATQKLLDDIEDAFTSHVARGRGVTQEYVQQNFGQGAIFVGQEAIERGLADGISSFKELLADASLFQRRKAKPKGSEMTLAVDSKADAEEIKVKENDLTPAAAFSQAEVDEFVTAAVTDERNRLSAIVKAQGGLTEEQFAFAVANPNIDAKTVTEVAAAFAPKKQANVGKLDSVMAGTNPTLEADKPDANEPTPKTKHKFTYQGGK